MSRYNIEQGLFGMVENSPSRLAAVGLYRCESGPEFQASELKVFELLSPHIRRAFKLHFRHLQFDVSQTLRAIVFINDSERKARPGTRYLARDIRANSGLDR